MIGASRPQALTAALAVLALLVAAAQPAASQTTPPPTERALYADGPSGRYLLDQGWTTSRKRNSGFRPVSIPNAFNADDYTARGFRSRVQWYRLKFSLPPGDATGWRLRFESVNAKATVWLNGRLLGSHLGAHLPFELRAGGVRPDGNELLVRVDGREQAGDIPLKGRERGWWNFGGILREVYLRRVTAADVADLQVTARLDGRVDVAAMVRNTTGAPLDPSSQVAVTGPDGFSLATAAAGAQLAPGTLGPVAASFAIPNPHPWTPDDPARYELKLMAPGGQVTTTHFGVREWSVSDGRALLNGRPLSLRGASFHEEAKGVGAALRQSDLDEIANELTALGADFTRQHYPAHPRLLEEFDRRGIVFWQQLPVWRLRGAQLRSARLRREAVSRLRQMVLRDRNHASVMAWSVGNELLRGGSAEEDYIRAARDEAKRLDPTRLVGIDKTLAPVRDLPRSYRLLDAIGLSAYLGWYGGSTRDLGPALDQARRRFPRQALFVTEFGAESTRSGPASRKGTYAFQSRFNDRYLDTIGRRPSLGGAIAWILRDFAVRPGWEGGNPFPRQPFNNKGLIDESGRRKPAFDRARQRFEAVPALAP